LPGRGIGLRKTPLSGRWALFRQAGLRSFRDVWRTADEPVAVLEASGNPAFTFAASVVAGGRDAGPHPQIWRTALRPNPPPPLEILRTGSARAPTLPNNCMSGVLEQQANAEVGVVYEPRDAPTSPAAPTGRRLAFASAPTTSPLPLTSRLRSMTTERS
jgi:hypothetical protein